MDIPFQIFINSIIAGSIYTLIALGFNFIYSVAKFFNLAHGAMVTVGGYTVFYLTKNLGWNLGISIIVGILFTGLVGWFLYKFVYLPLHKRKASNMVLLVASLGAFTAIQAIIAILFTSQFRTLAQTLGIQKSFELFGGVITQIQLIIIVCAILISMSFFLILYRTKFGKVTRAISDDEEVSKVIGIDTAKIIGYVFFIGSSIAGLVGILVGFDIGIEPTMGLELLLKGVIASIVGGVGNLAGGILGAFLLGFVENFGIWKISAEWKDAIAFLLLIIFLLVRPYGILKK